MFRAIVSVCAVFAVALATDPDQWLVGTNPVAQIGSALLVDETRQTVVVGTVAMQDTAAVCALQQLDVRDPSKVVFGDPFPLGSETVNTTVTFLASNGDRVYAACSNTSHTILSDVKLGGDISESVPVVLPLCKGGLVYHGNHLYYLCQNDFHIISVEEENKPAVVEVWPNEGTGFNFSSLARLGDDLYCMYDDDTVFGLPISSNGSLDLDGGELMSLRGGSAVNVLVSSPDTMRIYAIAEAFDNSHFSHTLFAIGLSETGGLIELDAASIELGNHSVLALAAYGDSIVAATEETLNLLEYDADTRATRQVGTGPYSLQTSATMQLSSTYGYIADAEGVLVAVNWSALAAPETWAPSPAPETSAPDTPMPSSYTPDVPYEPRDRTTFVFTILGIVAGAGLVASCVVGAFVVYNHRRKKNKAYEPQEAMSVWPSAIN